MQAQTRDPQNRLDSRSPVRYRDGAALARAVSSEQLLAVCGITTGWTDKNLHAAPPAGPVVTRVEMNDLCAMYARSDRDILGRGAYFQPEFNGPPGT